MISSCYYHTINGQTVVLVLSSINWSCGADRGNPAAVSTCSAAVTRVARSVGTKQVPVSSVMLLLSMRPWTRPPVLIPISCCTYCAITHCDSTRWAIWVRTLCVVAHRILFPTRRTWWLLKWTEEVIHGIRRSISSVDENNSLWSSHVILLRSLGWPSGLVQEELVIETHQAKEQSGRKRYQRSLIITC